MVYSFVRLGDSCSFQRGLTYKKTDEVDHSSQAVLRANNVSLTTNLLNYDDVKYLNEDVKIPDNKKVKKNSLLICTASGSKSHLGKVALIENDDDFSFGGFMGLLTPSEHVLPRYFYYVLTSQSYKFFISELMDGIGINNLKFSQLQEFTYCLPSLEEQKRIVAILDEAFAGIDQAIENTEKNLTNARELFESYLNNIFTQKGRGWEEKKLADIAEFKNGLNFTKSSKGESIAVLGVGDFKQKLWAPLSNLVDIQIDGNLPETYELQKNDIVVVRSNGNKKLIGRSLLIGEVEQKTSYSGFTIRVRLNTDEIAPFYLIHYLKSDYIHNLMTSAGGGASISNLNQKILSSLPIRYPDIGEQLEITKKIADLQEKQSQYIELTTKKLTAFKELKQSLLQKAFSGELTSDMREAA